MFVFIFSTSRTKPDLNEGGSCIPTPVVTRFSYSVLKGGGNAGTRYTSPPPRIALLIRKFHTTVPANSGKRPPPSHLTPSLDVVRRFYGLISVDGISMLRVGERGDVKTQRARSVTQI